MRLKKNNLFHYYIIPTAVAFFLVTMLVISILGTWYLSKNQLASLIAQDVQTLAEIFKKIDTTCNIVDFEYQQNPINFLNVGTFTGSQVGSMNIRYPHKWQGPYLQDNLTLQEHEYMIVKTHEGYFITPGNGVCLPNKKCIGSDIVLDEHARISDMIGENGVLKQAEHRFAIQILPVDQRSLPSIITED